MMRKVFAVNRLLSLGRAVKEGTLSQCLTNRRGERIPLSFPEARTTCLVLCGPEEISGTECDVDALRLLSPCVGRLDIIGFLEGLHDVQDDDRCIFLVDPESAVYVYDPSPFGGLYRLSHSMVGFMRRGLRRFDGIYKDPHVELVIRAEDGKSSLPETDKEAICCEGLSCIMGWPPGYTFVFGLPSSNDDDTERLSEEQCAFIETARLCVFGHFGPACYTGSYVENADRTPVFLGGDRAIYTFHRSTSRILRLAESLDMFYRIGLRRYFRNYRIIPSRLGDDVFFLPPD